MADAGYPVEFPKKLLSDLKHAAAAIRSAGSVTIVTHIDADGITAGAIADETLNRLGIPHVLTFEKKIADETVVKINSYDTDLVWICDLGSAYMGQFTRNGVVVTDHHVPDPAWRKGQSLLDSFACAHQLNPHLYGVDGSFEVCGAGMTYLLSKTIDPRNRDLAYIAVIGAIGDFQDTRERQLVSWNRLILQDAVDAGDVAVEFGLRYFGRGTRPLAQFLLYGEPAVPDITGDLGACIGLLECYGIPQAGQDGRKLSWCDLDETDRMVITDELMTRARNDEDRSEMLGELYTITRYSMRSGLGDAKEFATTLNSCGRYDDAETGARICRGDMSALADAERNRKDHRKHIAMALSFVKDNHLLRQRRYVQYFDAGSSIRETVVGIVAGIILSSEDAEPGKPIVAFAVAEDGIKVSARASKELVDGGLNLSKIMSEAAASVGGLGGGHSVAAGATIPEGKEEVFLDKLEELVSIMVKVTP